jgi:hypothetical protein
MSYISRGSFKETVVQNGRIIRDLDADSYSQGDKKHADFLIKGHDNNRPFLITNMKNGITRRPTPYPRRKKTGKRKSGKRRKSASKR